MIDPALPRARYKGAPLNLWTRQRRWIAAACALVLAAAFGASATLHTGSGEFFDIIAALFSWFYVRPDARVIASERRVARDRLEAEFKAANARWIEFAQATAFTAEVQRLSGIKAQLLSQQQRYDAEKRAMERDREKVEREAYMDAHVIADAKIRLIGTKTAAHCARGASKRPAMFRSHR